MLDERVLGGIAAIYTDDILLIIVGKCLADYREQWPIVVPPLKLKRIVLGL